jgi:hypothetical protein
MHGFGRLSHRMSGAVLAFLAPSTRGGEVVHDDVARPQLRSQHLLDPSSVRRRTIRSCKDGGQQTAEGP